MLLKGVPTKLSYNTGTTGEHPNHFGCPEGQLDCIPLLNRAHASSRGLNYTGWHGVGSVLLMMVSGLTSGGFRGLRV